MKAIITGGSSGLGYEIAKQLREKKYDVILIGRSREKLNNAKARLSEIESEATIECFDFDIADESNVIHFFKILNDRHEVITYLFNVAGKSYYGKIEEISHTTIMDTLQANMIGLMLMTVHGIKLFNSVPSSKQRIVSILSTAALKGKKYETIYNASKWGARGFLESVRDEVTSTHIDIINIYPGGMQTAFWDHSRSGYAVDTFMKPEDVAKQIVGITIDHCTWISDVTINRPRQHY
ncbi:short-subunit dehydrogenase [Anaerosolibacter carboniphilus]|uniref:Short-subunit dehydrogenase n=1 Tax=Anaerosolibacter carboniphilus TaxID=1417629 RepID=A0A841KYE2_9FIRM|nr:SDR family NAD(P)-dependent oxidoreductase [Anaerosolibacter carboniphilus]MBB6215932.1 short-subunit dehydrogenase [Anaerosolibacter carboniphilus]